MQSTAYFCAVFFSIKFHLQKSDQFILRKEEKTSEKFV